MIDGKETAVFKLKNINGMEMLLTNYGDRLVGLSISDKSDVLTDVVIGLGSADGYQRSAERYF